MNDIRQHSGFERVPIEDGETGEPIDGVRLTLLAGAERTNAQRFEIDPGTTVPVHTHDHEQVGQLFQGTLTFIMEDGDEIECDPGDSYAIASGQPHGARNDGEETAVGVEMFTPPRENPDWRS
ncbi:MAG: cupin domain-containing protein [Halodesulfurarchaeum sp.]